MPKDTACRVTKQSDQGHLMPGQVSGVSISRSRRKIGIVPEYHPIFGCPESSIVSVTPFLLRHSASTLAINLPVPESRPSIQLTESIQGFSTTCIELALSSSQGQTTHNTVSTQCSMQRRPLTCCFQVLPVIYNHPRFALARLLPYCSSWRWLGRVATHREPDSTAQVIQLAIR